MTFAGPSATMLRDRFSELSVTDADPITRQGMPVIAQDAAGWRSKGAAVGARILDLAPRWNEHG